MYDSDDDADKILHKSMNIGVDEEELREIKGCTKGIRILMIVTSLLSISISLTNMVVTDSNSKRFIALYVIAICIIFIMYEVALTSYASRIVINFGFLYNTKIRMMLMCSMGWMCYSFDFFGSIPCFSLIGMGCLHGYVGFVHPQYEEYMKKAHFCTLHSKYNRPLQHYEYYNVV